MNLRIFLTSSSLLLLGWLTASYFSATPIEGYLSKEQPASNQPEVVLVNSAQTFASAK